MERKIPTLGSDRACAPPEASAELETLRQRLARRMGQAIVNWSLIEEGDHVMVAVSGGKDSYTLLDLLAQYRRRAPISFEITAVHLDQGQPGYDGRPLRRWLENFEIPFKILQEDTYSVVLEHTPPKKAYCSVCSRLRRGILYNCAESLGCQKIALGHHRDDALETLLMNLFFGGRMQAMPAIYRTDDQRFEVIRPLIECAESDIAAYAKLRAFPILPCNLCGSQAGLQRQAMKTLLGELETQHPQLRSSMLGALKNVRASHLLDPTLRRESSDPPQSPSALVTLRTPSS